MALIGIDEVGRGAWAGPLCIGLVQFNAPFSRINELADSKLLPAKKRQDLSQQILQEARSSVGWAWPAEIDELGLTHASRLAIERGLAVFSDVSEILIDGKVNYLKGSTWQAVTTTAVKADQTVPEVMAASIIAKVARDAYMAELHGQYPLYGFLSHVGYGTKTHLAALSLHGITSHHRRSYKPIAALL